MNKSDIDKFIVSVIQPNKKYVVQIHKNSLTKEDAVYLADGIHKLGSEGLVVLYDDVPIEINQKQDKETK